MTDPRDQLGETADRFVVAMKPVIQAFEDMAQRFVQAMPAIAKVAAMLAEAEEQADLVERADHQGMVRSFMVKVAQPHPEAPTLAEYRADLRAKLMTEEAREFRDATNLGDWVEMIDAICDTLYVAYGAAIEMGIDIRPYFAEVHRTNMLKEGGPVRGDGKILKPPGWKPPRIAQMLHSQLHPFAPELGPLLLPEDLEGPCRQAVKHLRRVGAERPSFGPWSDLPGFTKWKAMADTPEVDNLWADYLEGLLPRD